MTSSHSAEAMSAAPDLIQVDKQNLYSTIEIVCYGPQTVLDWPWLASRKWCLFHQGSMPPFIQPSAFFSPLSPAPASSSPPYPAPTRPLPTSPSHQGGSSFPHPPTSPNHGSSSYPMPSAPSSSNSQSSSFPLPSPFSQAQLNNSTPYVQPSSSSSTFRIHPTNSTSSLRIPIAKRKTDMPEATMELSEPQRKVRY